MKLIMCSFVIYSNGFERCDLFSPQKFPNNLEKWKIARNWEVGDMDGGGRM